MADDRLDVPGRRRSSLLPKIGRETFGDFSESFARFMGTPMFIILMTGFIIVWLVWNVYAPESLQFDPRELNFTLLTLILSLQASYAAPLILLAQNRQDDRDRISLAEDRAVAEQSRADMAYLAREIAGLRQSMGELATRDYVRSELRNELRELLAEIEAHRPETEDDPAD